MILIPFVLLAAEPDGPRDLVWISTGDRVSGEIVKLEDGKLAVKTPFAGVIQIDWTKVERIESERDFAVQVGPGLQMLGRIERTEEGVRVVGEDTDEIVSPEELTGIEQADVKQTFWDSADLNIGLGASITGGNSVLRQNSLDAGFRHRTLRRKFVATARSIISKEDTSERINRNEVDVRMDRFLRPKLFYFWNGAYESDEKSLLDLRLTGGGGAGYQLRKTSRQDIALRIGLNVVREHFRAEDGSPASRKTSSEGMAGIDLERTTARNITLFLDAFVHSSIQQPRYRFVGDAGIRFPVHSFLKWSLSGFSRFDSRPPTDRRHHDYGLVTSFGFAW